MRPLALLGSQTLLHLAPHGKIHDIQLRGTLWDLEDSDVAVALGRDRCLGRIASRVVVFQNAKPATRELLLQRWCHDFLVQIAGFAPAPHILDMVPRFLENRESDAKKISQLLADADFGEIQRIGHNLKGSGSSYGFDRVSDIGRNLEESAKKNDADTIEKLQSELEAYLGAVVAYAKPDSE